MSQDEVTPRSLTIAESAAARLHDTAMERASARLLLAHGMPAIAVMGGHDVRRDDPSYRKVVEICWKLRRRGYLIVTGGGPGLMEAGNLGAFLANQPETAIAEAIRDLPEKNFKSHEWLKTAALVRAKFNSSWSAPIGSNQTSLAIPTWLYGHEPPNLFSSHIAKLFYNSLREDGLVTVAGGGIIFGPGNAGTVQEIFQDLTQNYYRGRLPATPMVFLDAAYWSRSCDDSLTFPPKKNPNKPLLPLMRQLAAEKDFLSAILVTDDVDEIVRFLDRSKPNVKSNPSISEARLKARIY
jgi:predicted Rossmann-fold nucleotide-binding protein